MCICTLIAVKHGLGRHIGTIHPHDLAVEGKAFFASELIWAASLPIIKISILLLYIRIFGRLRYFRILAYIIGIFSICWAIMVIIVCSFQCRPIQILWDRNVSGTCINTHLFFILGSAPNVFTDFVLLALPLPAVWSLHTTRVQKVSLTVIFVLGSLTCVISLVRLIQLITNTTADATWSLGVVSIWSVAEPNLGIVSACLPTMKPLFRRFSLLSKLHGPKASRHSRGSSSKNFPLATESFGSSGFNRSKTGRGQFRELQDDSVDRVLDLPRTRTFISSDEIGRDQSGIPLDVIDVKTNIGLQNVSRKNMQA